MQPRLKSCSGKLRLHGQPACLFWAWFCIICTLKTPADWEEGREEILDRGSRRRRDRKGFKAPQGRVCAFATGLWWEECILKRGQPTRQPGVLRSRLNTRLSSSNTISRARLLVCLGAHTERSLRCTVRVQASGAVQLYFLGPGEA